MSVIPTLRDIAVVIIALELFIILLIPGAIVYFMVRGIGWLQKQVKTYGPQARRIAGQVALMTEDASHKVAAPLIAISANTARAERIQNAVASTFARKEV